FSLKDKESLLNCVLFKGSGSKIKFTVKDGMQVVCAGRISVYDKRGQYQLYASEIEPKGKGALQLAFEQLKDKLSKEGIFDEKHKKAIPRVPLHVGIVTSPTGAAIKDILKVAKRRFENVDISIRPVRVQGEGSASEIAEAIKELNDYNGYIERTSSGEHPIDVIIVGRGGGSLEDLWSFNEEEVARAIYNSNIPVVSAVGHEIDYTISDFTADMRAPTPSAAAELILPRKEDLIARITQSRRGLYSAMKATVENLRTTVEGLGESYVLRNPVNVLLRMKQEIDEKVRGINTFISHFLDIKRKDLNGLAGKLHMLSPLAVLERGYSITLSGGSAIKDIRSVRKGDSIETRMHGGYISSTVIGVSTPGRGKEEA
ncbi:MAG: exodeoxyribonuclease VII large subunit, partial [Candidatus Omnitrophica bacterium]|nr:exodeoxyribonuclease VII large subunit [Candidatus Omnitrophota bacterium]